MSAVITNPAVIVLVLAVAALAVLKRAFIVAVRQGSVSKGARILVGGGFAFLVAGVARTGRRGDVMRLF